MGIVVRAVENGDPNLLPGIEEDRTAQGATHKDGLADCPLRNRRHIGPLQIVGLGTDQEAPAERGNLQCRNAIDDIDLENLVRRDRREIQEARTATACGVEPCLAIGRARWLRGRQNFRRSDARDDGSDFRTISWKPAMISQHLKIDFFDACTDDFWSFLATSRGRSCVLSGIEFRRAGRSGFEELLRACPGCPCQTSAWPCFRVRNALPEAQAESSGNMGSPGGARAWSEPGGRLVAMLLPCFREGERALYGFACLWIICGRTV